MTYNDIITLAKAGFTAYQISSLANVQNTTQTQPAVQTVQAQPAVQTVQTQPVVQTVQTQPVVQTVQTQPVVQPEVQTVQTVQAQPAVQQVQAQPTVQTPYNSPDHILQAINSVNDTMRQMQINMSNQPKRETTDDIIAAIINPPMPQKGDN